MLLKVCIHACRRFGIRIIIVFLLFNYFTQRFSLYPAKCRDNSKRNNANPMSRAKRKDAKWNKTVLYEWCLCIDRVYTRSMIMLLGACRWDILFIRITVWHGEKTHAFYRHISHLCSGSQYRCPKISRRVRTEQYIRISLTSCTTLCGDQFGTPVTLSCRCVAFNILGANADHVSQSTCFVYYKKLT